MSERRRRLSSEVFRHAMWKKRLIMFYAADVYFHNFEVGLAQSAADREAKKNLPRQRPEDAHYTLKGDLVELKEVGGLTSVFATSKGVKRERMEDHHFVCEAAPLPYYEAPEALEGVIAEVQRETEQREMRDGATLVLGLLSKDHTWTAATVADSPAGVIIRDVKKGLVELIRTCRLHKITDPEECQRVKAAGGNVIGEGTDNPHILLPNGRPLRVPRALGHKGFPPLEPKPDLVQIELHDHVHDDNKQVIVMVGSDGGWDYFSEENLETVLQQQYPPGKKMPVDQDLAELIKNIMRKSGTDDNVTVGLFEVTRKQNATVAFGVSDGHGFDGNGVSVAHYSSVRIPQLLADPKKMVAQYSKMKILETLTGQSEVGEQPSRFLTALDLAKSA